VKIAQVTEFYAPWAGGISQHVSHLSRELRRMGHEVRIVTSRYRIAGGAPADPELEASTCRLAGNVRFPYNGGMASVTYAPHLPRTLDRLFERESFDIVHIHNPMTPVLPILALDRSPAINVGTFHSYHPTERMLRWWRWAIQPRLSRLHLALAVSSSARDAFERYFDNPYEIVPNGIDLVRFTPNGHVPAANGEQTLLFVGQLVPKKGLPVLLQSFDMLLEEFPRLRLQVVGDGPMESACRRSLSTRTRERVEFLGQLHGSQLVQTYQACDVFCASSIGNESFGITLLEAMAAGKPIVASRIAGYCDVVRDGQEAMLYASEDPRDLVQVLRRVVTDAGLRTRLAAAGRARVQRYGWPEVARAIAARYEGLLRERC